MSCNQQFCITYYGLVLWNNLPNSIIYESNKHIYIQVIYIYIYIYILLAMVQSLPFTFYFQFVL